MNVTLEKLFYLATRIYIVHIGVNDNLEHHAGMVGTTAYSVIELMELAQVKLVNYGRNDSYRVIACDIFIYSLREKNDLVGIVRTIM